MFLGAGAQAPKNTFLGAGVQSTKSTPRGAIAQAQKSTLPGARVQAVAVVIVYPGTIQVFSSSVLYTYYSFHHVC